MLLIPHILSIKPNLYNDCGGYFIFRTYVNAKVTHEELSILNNLKNHEIELHSYIQQLLNSKYPEFIQQTYH